MKKSLIFALALMIVIAFASSAMAAQVLDQSSYLSTATGVYYTPTSVGNVYRTSGLPVLGQFNNDGTTNYPYEIYLPNESNPAQYRIHSSYAKNTDACASCHSTHTAVGNTLLQWYSTYETCMACHDGTVTTTYDVQSGKIGTGKPAMGGAFGTTAGSISDSNHNVTGALNISAAPGGSTATNETVSLLSGTQTRWVPTFGCESCHTPHGNGGNARILNPDANYAASNAAKANTTGYAVVGGAVYLNGTDKAYILKGYPYNITYYAGANPVAVDTTTNNVYIDNKNGYSMVYGTVAGTITRVYGTPALQVKMTIGQYLNGAAVGGETVQHNSGMNAFCGACHTDYNTEKTLHSSDTTSGTYTQAHRHQVGVPPLYNQQKNNLPAAGMVLENGNLECLTCHVAHGVNADYWERTVGTTGTSATGYLQNTDLVELAGSSALKRLPNMGTCEACHQKGASNEGYGALGSDPEDQTDGSPNWNTANAGAGFLLNYPVAKDGAADTDKAFFIEPGIFFNDEVNVGSAACGKCHTEYYNAYIVGDHVRAGGNGLEQLAQAGFGTASKPITMASGLNSKIRTYPNFKITDFLTYKKVSSTVSIATYSAAGSKGGSPGATANDKLRYYILLTNNGTVIDIYNEGSINTPTPNAKHATIAIKDVFVDGHAGEGYIYADKSVSNEVYALDRLFPFADTTSTQALAGNPENIYDGTIAPNLELIVYAEKIARAKGDAQRLSTPETIAESESLERKEGACNSCHTPRFDAKMAAGVLDVGVSCEACHGPGQKHANAPTKLNIFNPKTNFTTGSVAGNLEAQVDLCLTCHSSQEDEEHHYGKPGFGSYAIQQEVYGGYKDSLHFTSAKLVCTDCHDLHKATRDAFIVQKTSEQLCAACHDNIGGLSAAGAVSKYMYSNYSATFFAADPIINGSKTLSADSSLVADKTVTSRTYAAMNHKFIANQNFSMTSYPVR